MTGDGVQGPGPEAIGVGTQPVAVKTAVPKIEQSTMAPASSGGTIQPKDFTPDFSSPQKAPIIVEPAIDTARAQNAVSLAGQQEILNDYGLNPDGSVRDPAIFQAEVKNTLDSYLHPDSVAGGDRNKIIANLRESLEGYERDGLVQDAAVTKAALLQLEGKQVSPTQQQTGKVESTVGEVKSLTQFLNETSLEDRKKVAYDMVEWNKLVDGWVAETGSKIELMKLLAKDGDIKKYLLGLYSEDFSQANMGKFLEDIASLNLKDEDMKRLLPQIRGVAHIFGERAGAGITMLTIRNMTDAKLKGSTTALFMESLNPESKQFVAKLADFSTDSDVEAFLKGTKVASSQNGGPKPISVKEVETSSSTPEQNHSGNFQVMKGGVAHKEQALDSVHWNGGDYAIGAAELGITPDQIKTHGELEILMDTATGGGREASYDTQRFAEAFARYYYDSSNYGANDPQVRAREAYDYAKGMVPAQAAFAYLVRQGDAVSVGAVGNINVVKLDSGGAQYILDMNSAAKSAYEDTENPGEPVLKSQLSDEEKTQWETRVNQNPSRYKRVSATVLIATKNSRLTQSQTTLAKGDAVFAHTDGFPAKPADYQGKNVAEIIATTNSGDDVMAIFSRN